jgi:hypothetical protein
MIVVLLVVQDVHQPSAVQIVLVIVDHRLVVKMLVQVLALVLVLLLLVRELVPMHPVPETVLPFVVEDAMQPVQQEDVQVVQGLVLQMDAVEIVGVVALMDVVYFAEPVHKFVVWVVGLPVLDVLMLVTLLALVDVLVVVTVARVPVFVEFLDALGNVTIDAQGVVEQDVLYLLAHPVQVLVVGEVVPMRVIATALRDVK